MRTAMAVAVSSVVAMSMAGCGKTYEEFVKDDLKIPFVFVPPSNEFRPYSIVAYADNDRERQSYLKANFDTNYITVCSPSMLLDITDAEFKRKYLDDSNGQDIGTYGYKSNGNYSIGVKLSPAQIASVGGNYEQSYTVELNFSNGKVFTVNDNTLSPGSLYTSMSSNPHCVNSELAFVASSGFKFVMVLNLFRYDTTYTITNNNKVDVTATLPPALTQTILREASAKLGSDSKLDMTATKMFVGFRGVPESLPTNLTMQPTPAPIIAVATPNPAAAPIAPAVVAPPAVATAPAASAAPALTTVAASATNLSTDSKPADKAVEDLKKALSNGGNIASTVKQAVENRLTKVINANLSQLEK